MALLAAEHNITIEQGSVFQLFFIWLDTLGLPVNLTGYSGKMEIKPFVGGSVLDSIVSGGEMTLGGTGGTVIVDLTATITAAYTFARAKYDIELLPAAVAADAVRILEGEVFLSKVVTV